jgi:hypothetical protein
MRNEKRAREYQVAAVLDREAFVEAMTNWLDYVEKLEYASGALIGYLDSSTTGNHTAIAPVEDLRALLKPVDGNG